MLDEILRVRVLIKDEMKAAGKVNKVLWRVLNARQMALKLIANVTYGYTAASFSGRMPCVELADSIVETGRRIAEAANSDIEGHSAWGAQVVYGDTDSLFVKFAGVSKTRAFELGEAIARYVTRANAPPIKLKLEKIYLPCILPVKKRYVGYMYESPEQAQPVMDVKGLEIVRRDFSPIVGKLMEKSLAILFSSRDLSSVKRFLQRQFLNISLGQVSLVDFIFAKEVKLGRYKNPPPAAILAHRLMLEDPRAEPRYGERVPYVIVCGPPNARLVDLVRTPSEVASDPSLSLNSKYYLTKQIIPALARLYSLMGVDVAAWYRQLPPLPRVSRSATHAAAPRPAARATLTQHFPSQLCPLCGELTTEAFCNGCEAHRPRSAAILLHEEATLLRRRARLHASCAHCTHRCAVQQECTSIDCPIFFERASTQIEVARLASFSRLLQAWEEQN